MKNKKNVRVGRVEASQETQDGANHPIESAKGVLEGSKSSSIGYNTELEPALNKFFGGPPFCLILPDDIEANTKPRTGKRPCKGRVQLFSRSYAIVTWMDVLSEATTADQFQRQESGMYWCRVKGRLVEMSAENYHFIALGYPQRMMQPSYMSGEQREQETAGVVEKQDLSPTKVVVEPATDSPDNAVPGPMDIPRSSIASDLSHQSEKSTTISYQGERDVKGLPDVAQELQSQRKQDFSGWAPVLVPKNPVTSEDDPIKSEIPTHIDDGGAGSSDVTKQPKSETSTSGNKAKRLATPVRRKNVFIPWDPSPKKGSGAQEGSAASNTSPRAEPPTRYSTRELNEGPAFIKSLIEAGTPWQDQEEMYKSKFGISRSQWRLVKTFNLVDMQDGGFDKAAFKKRWNKSKSQATGGEDDKNMDKGKERDPGPSDAA